MNYQEHLVELRKIPLSKPQDIKSHIINIKDQTLQDNLCAKWFCSLLNEVKFIPEPVAPPEWIEYKAAKEYKTEAWRGFYLTFECQEYVHQKRIIENSNYSNYMKLRVIKSLLHKDEEQLRLKVRALMEEFEKGLKSQKEPPFECYNYDFFNSKRKMSSYN